MNKAQNAQIDAIVSAIVSMKSKVASAANQKRADETIATVRSNAKVQALLIAQDVKASEVTDLYETMRAVRFFKEITSDVFNVAKCDENFIVTVKTLINAAAADSDVTKRDIENALLFTAADVRAHVYQRKTKIDSARQVQMCLSALKLTNMQDRATNKARDCEALKIARDKLANVAL